MLRTLHASLVIAPSLRGSVLGRIMLAQFRRIAIDSDFSVIGRLRHHPRFTVPSYSSEFPFGKQGETNKNSWSVAVMAYRRCATTESGNGASFSSRFLVAAFWRLLH